MAMWKPAHCQISTALMVDITRPRVESQLREREERPMPRRNAFRRPSGYRMEEKSSLMTM